MISLEQNFARHYRTLTRRVSSLLKKLAYADPVESAGLRADAGN
jgi:hypothetical protein